jgi:hypothetical protein
MPTIFSSAISGSFSNIAERTFQEEFFLSAFFTHRASQSHSIGFVAAHSRYINTASWATPSPLQQSWHVNNPSSLILFIEIFGCHSADQSGENDQRNQIGEGHEGVGHISYVPDYIQMDPLDYRADKKKGYERETERKDDLDAE